MLKKILGGLSLLTFVVAFTMPLLVTTNTANSDDNRVDYYLYRVHLTCPDGSVIGSYDEWRSVSWTGDDHPPNNCGYWEFDNLETEDPDDTYWEFACLHVSHWTTYRVYDTPTNTNVDVSERACR